MPERLKNEVFYQPTNQGLEQKIKEKLQRLKINYTLNARIFLEVRVKELITVEIVSIASIPIPSPKSGL